MSIDLGLQDLYKDNRSKIMKMVMNNSGTYDDACDVLQDGVIVVWKKFKGINPIELTCSLSTYLYSVCRNIWLNELRKRNKSELKLLNESIVEKTPDQDEIDALMAKEKMIKLVEKGMEGLGKTCKELLKLKYFKNLSMEKLAFELGLSNKNAAKTKKYKCIQQLKKKLI